MKVDSLKFKEAPTNVKFSWFLRQTEPPQGDSFIYGDEAHSEPRGHMQHLYTLLSRTLESSLPSKQIEAKKCRI